MPTALITGASGFTGRYLTDSLLQRGFQVFGLDKSVVPGIELVSCDLTDPVETAAAISQIKPEWVIHLAALSFVGHDDQQAFYDVNVFGTLNLLQALANQSSPPQRVLIASSANVYGLPSIEMIDETVCPKPVNHYACSKLVMEHMVANWFERLPIILTRPFNYTGVGQDNRFLIPKIVEHYANNKKVIELGNIDISRDFTDVRDLVNAYMALLESEQISSVYNICSGKATSLRSVLDTMSRLAGYEMEVQVNPEFVRANEIPRLCGDNSRICAATSWQPSIPFESTLQAMFEAARLKC